MRTDCLSSIDFQGKVVILNTLSHKPYLNIKKAENNFIKQIKSKNYNLYIEQDYSLNKINIGVSSLNPRTMSENIEHEELPITAKSNRYIYAAKNAIEKYEKAQEEIKQKAWKQEQKKREIENIKDVIETILLSPVFIAEEIIRSINPKWANKFENLLQKIGI